LFDATDAEFRSLVTPDHERQENLPGEALFPSPGVPALTLRLSTGVVLEPRSDRRVGFCFLRKTFPFTRSHLLM